jgi:hypothetical protein
VIWNVTTLAIARDSARRFEVGPGEVEAGTAVFFIHTARSIFFVRPIDIYIRPICVCATIGVLRHPPKTSY